MHILRNMGLTFDNEKLSMLLIFIILYGIGAFDLIIFLFITLNLILPLIGIFLNINCLPLVCIFSLINVIGGGSVAYKEMMG